MNIYDRIEINPKRHGGEIGDPGDPNSRRTYPTKAQ